MKVTSSSFHSVYSQGFLRAAVAVPKVKVADPRYNAERTLALAERASAEGAGLVVFPELGLSAYSNQDLFHQQALLEASEAALARVIEASRNWSCVTLVGVPVVVDARLFNCAAVVYRGELLGLVPKTYLPNYREFYEARHFAPASLLTRDEIVLCDQQVPIGNDLLFEAAGLPGFILGIDICEDFWTPIPPSSLFALAGATVLVNLSASPVTVAKADYRRLLCAAQSGRTAAAYLYSACGFGESTTDLAWDGHGMIWENGTPLAETERYATEDQLLVADLDLERLAAERLRWTAFHQGSELHAEALSRLRRVSFDFEVPSGTAVEQGLRRRVDRFPYVPADPATLEERCHEVYHIQVQGLAQRLSASGIKKLVIGVSGGLDSTQALLVAALTMDRLGLPRTNVLAYTLPGFATSRETHANAWRLMQALGVSAQEIDIRPSCLQMLKDLGHPAATGEPVYDITYENVQAGERTSHLFRLANLHGALVLGTGDLSELALGWCTYGVGDHMSHYNVNASVPKTLIRHLIRWETKSGRFDAATDAVLADILGTAISPELIPAEDGNNEKPAQRTEDEIGPYELQDFHLYYITRFGFRPSRVAYLALQAWGDANRGAWPESIPEADRRAYDLATIKKWLAVFLKRFFAQSQFKRSALPDGPKVGSGGSLSPRGDWRAPSDASAVVWLEELAEKVPS